MIRLVIFFCFVFAYFPCLVLANSDVVIIGNKRVAEDIIVARLHQHLGKRGDVEDFGALVKALYSTQLFHKVSAERKDGKIMIRVEENPIIENILFRGNSKLSSKDLMGMIATKPLSILKKEQLGQDINAVKDEYKKKGIFSSSVTTEQEALADGKINLVFRIKESPKVMIREIKFMGNEAFTSSKLSGVMLSKTFSWSHFFSNSHYYIPDRLEVDSSLLRDFYLRNGYMDFNVLNTSVEIAENHAYINIAVQEGEKYRVTDVKLEADFVHGELLRKLHSGIKTKAGSDFNISGVNDDVEIITNILNNTGHLFAQVEPKYITKGSAQVGLNYLVSKGEKVYINRIDISGNDKTRDSVIRKILLFSEGDPFNAIKMKDSKLLLMRTGFFSTVEVETKRVKDRYVDVIVKVAEQSTGSIKLSTGYSSSAGVIGMAGYKDTNIFGTGNEVFVSLEKSANNFGGNLGLVKRFIGNNNTSIGGSVFKQQAKNDKSSYFNDSNGFVVWGEIPINLKTALSLRYSYTDSDIQLDTTSSRTSPAILQMLGRNKVSNVGYSLVYSTVDNFMLPHNGFYVKLSQDLAGIGGDVSYLRTEFSSSVFIPVLQDRFTDVVYKSSLRAGNIFDYKDDSLAIAYNFFMGIDEIRGFAISGIGARDTIFDEALGGKKYASWVNQVSFPLLKEVEEIEKFSLRGVVFFDAATLFGLDYKSTDVVDDKSFRTSAGFGLSWITPFGPMSIDFGFPIHKTEHDKTQIVRFTLGANL